MFIGNIASVNVATHKIEHQQSVNRVSTECQQNINRALTISGVVSCITQELCDGIYQ